MMKSNKIDSTRQKYQKQRDRIFFRGLLILLCVLIFFIVYQRKESTSKERISAFESEDWKLELVNKWNPIKDNEFVETVTLSNGKQVDRRIYPDLQEMFDDMREAGIYPIVASGYRTEEDQKKIYDDKYFSYKAAGFSDRRARKNTEKWVAVPGRSEHQLGLGVDINADNVRSSGEEVYNWLAENAYKYGFIYRYPADKEKTTGIKNERWHYRYVGVGAATEIYEKDLCLEEYLGK